MLSVYLWYLKLVMNFKMPSFYNSYWEDPCKKNWWVWNMALKLRPVLKLLPPWRKIDNILGAFIVMSVHLHVLYNFYSQPHSDWAVHTYMYTYVCVCVCVCVCMPYNLLFPHLSAMKWWGQMPWSLFFEYWVLSQLFHFPLSLSLRGFLVPLHLLP